MYIGYVNYTMNDHGNIIKGKKKIKTDSYDLKRAFEHLDNLAFPITSGNLTIKKIEVCSNSCGCSIKSKQTKKNVFVRLKNENTIRLKPVIPDANSGKYTLMNLTGTYKLNGEECNVFIRIPRSIVIGFKIGLSKQTSIRVNNGNNVMLQNLGTDLEKDFFGLFKNKSGLPQRIRPLKISTMTVFGLNIFNPETGKRPVQRIDNFMDFANNLDDQLKSHYLDFNLTNAKSVVKANYKPHTTSDITFGITQWGMVDMMRVSSLAKARETKNIILNAFTKIRKNIEYNEHSKFKEKKVKGSCSKRNPAPTNGECPGGFLPLPNKHKTLCCYKKKLTQTLKRQIVPMYASAGLNIPQSLLDSLNLQGMAPKNTCPQQDKSKINLPSFSTKNGKFYYKRKPFDSSKCMTLSKPKLLDISKSLGANPGRFKKDICSSIMQKSKQQSMNKRKRVRRKFLEMINKKQSS